MENETNEPSQKNWCNVGDKMKHHACCHGSGGALYFVGFLGALYYYLTTATSFLAGVIGLVKALLWPAFMVYGLLNYLGM